MTLNTYISTSSLVVASKISFGCLRIISHISLNFSKEKGIVDGDAWGDDEGDYYNDRPDARPPLAETAAANYSAPKSNLPVSHCTAFWFHDY